MGIVKGFAHHEIELLCIVAIMLVAHKLLRYFEVRQKGDPTLKIVLWICSTASLFGAAILFVGVLVHFLAKALIPLYKDIFPGSKVTGK